MNAEQMITDRIAEGEYDKAADKFTAHIKDPKKKAAAKKKFIANIKK